MQKPVKWALIFFLIQITGAAITRFVIFYTGFRLVSSICCYTLCLKKMTQLWNSIARNYYSRVIWLFLPNFIKIDPYNFELYHFKVGSFFETQCVFAISYNWPGNACYILNLFVYIRKNIWNKLIQLRWHSLQVGISETLNGTVWDIKWLFYVFLVNFTSVLSYYDTKWVSEFLSE